MMSVTVNSRTQSQLRDAAFLKKLGRKVCRILKKEHAAMDVYLISDREMSRLNLQFRKKKGSTNVLSFPEKGDFCGEIYISPSYIKRQARRGDYGIKNYRALLSYMFIHSVLHLFGYTHRKKRDRIKMERKEQALLTRLHVSYRHRS